MPTQWRRAAEDDDDLRIVARHPVVADERRLDAVLRELPQELERDVGDDLDVHPEWSLISMRTLALMFAACHQAFSCLSSLTRSMSVRSFLLPRTGTLMRICSTACAG